MNTKNNFVVYQRKIFDLKNVLIELKKENKYYQLKEEYLKQIFEYSIQIIKKYIRRIENNNEEVREKDKNEIYTQLLKDFQIQKEKQKDDINLMIQILKTLKIKVKDFNNEYLNKSELEEKRTLSLDKFILINEIKEKDSIIQKMKLSNESIKTYNFVQEFNREIYLNLPLNININQGNINMKKLNKQISKIKNSNIEKIKTSIDLLNIKIKEKQNKNIKTKLKEGYIVKLNNERFNTKLIINMHNYDSDDSDCSSNSDKFSFEELNIEIEQIDYDSSSKNSDLSLNNNHKYINSDFNENNLLNEHLNFLKKNFLKLTKTKNQYIHQINKIKNLNKKMRKYVKKLKSTISLSQNSNINHKVLIKKPNYEIKSKDCNNNNLIIP
jgi:hypothetical protein